MIDDFVREITNLTCENSSLKCELQKIENQQKGFIKFLEDNWKDTQDIWYIKILNKYKEIIGEKNDN